MVNNQEKEKKELDDMTIKALEESKAGFDVFSQMFKKCSDFYDNGSDFNGTELLTKEIIPSLQDFAAFCASLLETTFGKIKTDTQNKFEENCKNFETLLQSLLEEMKGKNYIEVGDILRFDLFDLMKDFAEIFETMAKNLQSSKK